MTYSISNGDSFNFRLAVAALALTLGSPIAAEAGAPEGSWLSAVRQDIAREEYSITWQESAWQAPNRAHAIRSYFTDDGAARVVPRMETSPSWDWTTQAVRWGRVGGADFVTAAGAGEVPRVSSNRIEIDRGTLLEWFLNDPRGLEHGFTLQAPPAGSSSGAILPVWIELVPGGTVTAVLSADGQAVDFVTGRGVHVIHAALSVRDAEGRTLPSRVEATEGGLRLVFDDEDSVYPVIASLLATSSSWSAEGNQAESGFGISVATAGDVNGDGFSDVIVGAHAYDNGQADEGRAFVYHGTAAGLSSSAAWTAESDQVGAIFGVSVGTVGDVNGDGFADVIVGAQLYDNPQNAEGRAFVYHGSASGLGAAPAWIAESDQSDALFGSSVGTAGDVNADGYADVVIGAHEAENGQAEEGRVFVYHGSASGLAATAAWTAESNQAQSEFGVSVATAGDVNGDGYSDIIVGARAFDNGQPDEGRAFVYLGSGAGLATSPVWTAESDQADARFAAQVAPAGDVNSDGYADVLVGSADHDNGETGEGRASVYHGSSTGVASVAAWTVEGNQAGAALGSVASAGDVNGDGYADAIVGAPGYDNGEMNEGRAFVYYGSTSGLAGAPAWTVESDQAGASLGAAVATAGDVNGDGHSDVIAGATGYDSGETNEGSAFVYQGSAAGPSTGVGWSAVGAQAGAGLGISVASAGDVNGDGFGDVIVGASLYDNGQTNEGRAFVFHGSGAGLLSSAAWTAESNQPLSSFSFSVGRAGDVNGDGYDDVIVGATRWDVGQEDEGGAFVYHGSATGLANGWAWMTESNLEYSRMGGSVGTAGDVNGDGYADVIVAARFFGEAQSDKGKAFVHHGSPSGLSLVANWSVEGVQNNQQFASAVGTAGDVNRDGYSDVIVGSSGTNTAFVYHGAASGLPTAAAWTAQGGQAGAGFGSAAATAGDVNGDGYSDVIVGALFYDNGQADEGGTFVYHGSPTGLSAAPAWTAEGNQAGASFGNSAETAGDVNGDGYADVIVGAPLYDNVQSGEGRAFVYLGSATGLTTGAAWTAESDQVAANFGRSVAGAGDVNGDGYAEVIVGAQAFDDTQSDEGRAYLFYGNGGAGMALRPRQLRVADSGPIARLGRSDSAGGFRLALLGRSPFGRGQVKLQWEVKPIGAPLDGTAALAQTGWSDTGTAGAPLAGIAGDLVGGQLYHWRVRALHDPVTVPFLPHGRWLTVPWSGWQESMLRTANADPNPPGRVPTLLVEKSGAVVRLIWGPSCAPGTSDYAIYEGTIGNFTSHTSRFCTTEGATQKTFTPPAGSVYYLVVPLSQAVEGSYGTTSAGAERPVGTSVCRPQQLGTCSKNSTAVDP